MYIFSDRFYQKEYHPNDKIVLDDHKKQFIFTTYDHKTIHQWLQEHHFPETFIEDIVNEDQTVAYEQNDDFKMAIFKYFVKDEDEEMLYHPQNVVIILSHQKLIFLARDRKILQSIVTPLFRRLKPNDSIEYVTYLLIDMMVDHAMNIIDKIDNRLEELEDTIFDASLEEQEVQKYLYFARRTLNRISKISIQHSDIVNKIINHFPAVIRKKLKYEIIDLKEHLSFLIHESKAYLDRTGYLQTLLMGFLSNRMNQAMQRLAAISLIFLPLTFIVGNYGMNFKYMPELEWQYGYLLTWGLNITIAWLIFKWLKRKRWI